jgi:putative transposase
MENRKVLAMPFVEAYFHLIWATKYRQAILNPSIEAIIFEAIRSKSKDLRSPIHGINAAHDHIHVAVTIAPSIAASDWVRQVKSVSSLHVNREFTQLENPFRWQGDYGYYTLGKKAMPFLLNYISSQKERHKNNELEPYLEQIPDDNED